MARDVHGQRRVLAAEDAGADAEDLGGPVQELLRETDKTGFGI